MARAFRVLSRSVVRLLKLQIVTNVRDSVVITLCKQSFDRWSMGANEFNVENYP